MIALIDTNILLDVLQRRQPYEVVAAEVWKLVEHGFIEGVVSAISFNNIYYIARKRDGKDKALEAVKLVRQTFRVIALDADVIDEAIATSGSDFEDAIQAACAKRASAKHIITRNISDFVALDVHALTADELLALVKP
jgi:predicted nucleic acid-binding protein